MPNPAYTTVKTGNPKWADDAEYCNALASQGSVLGDLKSAPQPPVAQLYDALNRLRETATLADAVTGRLVGPVPEERPEGRFVDGVGVFSEIEAIAAEIDRLSHSIRSSFHSIQLRL